MHPVACFWTGYIRRVPTWHWSWLTRPRVLGISAVFLAAQQRGGYKGKCTATLGCKHSFRGGRRWCRVLAVYGHPDKKRLSIRPDVIAGNYHSNEPVDMPITPSFISGIGAGRVLSECGRWSGSYSTAQEIAEAIRLLYERQRIAAEGAGSAPPGAALAGRAVAEKSSAWCQASILWRGRCMSTPPRSRQRVLPDTFG